jgi:hypothetical protein
MRSVRCTAAAAVSILGVSILLAACSGGGPGALPSAPGGSQTLAQRSPSLRAAKAGKGVYVVTGTASELYVINEYPLNDSKDSAPLCTIPAGTSIFPGDIATDKKGNLWVPTIATPSISSVWEVVEYAPGCGAQGSALEENNIGEPIAVAFNSKGTAYVANEVSASFGPGNVAVFPAGHTSPTKVLTSPLIGGYVTAIAIDASDNVFITCDNASFHTEVLEFVKGKGTGQAVNVTGYSVINGITFDKHQNMILTDYEDVQDEVYAPPYSGAPTATMALASGENPLYSKLNKSNNTLYVTSTKGLSAYSYPAGAFKYSVTNQMGQFGAGGMAVDPPSRR